MKTIDGNDVRVTISITCPNCNGDPPPFQGEAGGCGTCQQNGRAQTALSLDRVRDLLAELETPGSEEPGADPEPIPFDETAIVCWPGVFHEASPGNERKADHFEVDSGIRRLEIELDVRFGGFAADGSHALIWCHRGPWKGPGMKWKGNQLAYLNLIHRGGGVSLQQRVSVDPEATSNRKAKVPQTLKTGLWYHVRYVYNGMDRFASTTLTLDESPIAAIKEQDDHFRTLTAAAGCSLVIGHGPDEAGPEQPSYGWSWANLVLHETQ